MALAALVPCILCFLCAAAVPALGAPSSDLVDKLPGQPDVSFKQYAGYVTVNETAGRALFYYFVEAETNSSSRPLTLWLNGGPGCSSLGGGGFTELGPFFPRVDGRTLVRNDQSWNKASNLIFLESPAGVGWSYSNTSTDYMSAGDASTAADSLAFLLGWFEKFPEYKSNDFYIAGESYAGHYVPQLASSVLAYKGSDGFKFNLKGIAIGNPLLRLDVDTSATYDYLWSHGVISDTVYEDISTFCKFEYYTLGTETHNVTDSCTNALMQADDELGNYTNNYDITLDVCETSLVHQELRLRNTMAQMSNGVDICITNERNLYLNLPEVQDALHANVTKLPYPWSMCSGLVQYNLDDARTNMIPLLKDLYTHGLRIWAFRYQPSHDFSFDIQISAQFEATEALIVAICFSTQKGTCLDLEKLCYLPVVVTSTLNIFSGKLEDITLIYTVLTPSCDKIDIFEKLLIIGSSFVVVLTVSWMDHTI